MNTSAANLTPHWKPVLLKTTEMKLVLEEEAEQRPPGHLADVTNSLLSGRQPHTLAPHCLTPTPIFAGAILNLSSTKSQLGLLLIMR